MKIRLSVLLTILFVMTASGCSPEELRFANIPADHVIVGYGVSSYMLFSEDEDTIKELHEIFRPLIFEKSEGKIDFMSAFSVVFQNDEEVTARIRVDKYGLFELDDEEGTFKLKKGDFDYNRLKAIFEKDELSN